MSMFQLQLTPSNNRASSPVTLLTLPVELAKINNDISRTITKQPRHNNISQTRTTQPVRRRNKTPSKTLSNEMSMFSLQSAHVLCNEYTAETALDECCVAEVDDEQTRGMSWCAPPSDSEGRYQWGTNPELRIL